MATECAIFIEKDNGKFIGTNVFNDGYIQIENNHGYPASYGVGYFLEKYWDDKKDIMELCKGNAIIDLDSNIENSRFASYREENMSNLTYDEVCNLEYNYIYMYVKNTFGYHWIVRRNDNDKSFSLSCFLDYDDSERFRDDKAFWC